MDVWLKLRAAKTEIDKMGRRDKELEHIALEIDRAILPPRRLAELAAEHFRRRGKFPALTRELQEIADGVHDADN